MWDRGGRCVLWFQAVSFHGLLWLSSTLTLVTFHVTIIIFRVLKTRAHVCTRYDLSIWSFAVHLSNVIFPSVYVSLLFARVPPFNFIRGYEMCLMNRRGVLLIILEMKTLFNIQIRGTHFEYWQCDVIFSVNIFLKCFMRDTCLNLMRILLVYCFLPYLPIFCHCRIVFCEHDRWMYKMLRSV